jgi:hypothetical protein
VASPLVLGPEVRPRKTGLGPSLETRNKSVFFFPATDLFLFFSRFDTFPDKVSAITLQDVSCQTDAFWGANQDTSFLKTSCLTLAVFVHHSRCRGRERNGANEIEPCFPESTGCVTPCARAQNASRALDDVGPSSDRMGSGKASRNRQSQRRDYVEGSCGTTPPSQVGWRGAAQRQ